MNYLLYDTLMAQVFIPLFNNFLSVSFYQVLFCVLGSLEMNMVEHFWKFLSLWYFYSNGRQPVYKIISDSGGSDWGTVSDWVVREKLVEEVIFDLKG